MLHGRDDVGVSATAADISVHGLLDVLVSGADWFFKESYGGHDLARGTVAALVSVVLDEGSLHDVKIVRLTDALDRCDLVHRVHDGEGKTGVHASTVDVYGASSALSVITTLLCARHADVFAQAIEQGRARVEIEIVFFAIDAQRYRDRALNPVRGYRFFRDGGGGMSRSRCKDG